MAGGQRVGYIRVSSAGQNPARQLDGVELDQVFTDIVSGKSAARPQLQAMLAYVRDRDAVIAHSMGRLARSLDDLRRLARELTGRGVAAQFLNEQLTITAEDAPVAAGAGRLRRVRAGADPRTPAGGHRLDGSSGLHDHLMPAFRVTVAGPLARSPGPLVLLVRVPSGVPFVAGQVVHLVPGEFGLVHGPS